MTNAFRLIVVLAATLLAATVALGDGLDWSISQFDVDIEIRQDGSLLVTERIVADFSRERHRGIYREIPYSYRRSGMSFGLRMEVLSVEDENGGGHPYRVRHEDGRVRIRVGDPNVYLQRAVTYVLTYQVQRALLRFDTHDELYWNATGNEWGVPIERATCTVRIAGDAPAESIRATSYAGPYGSQTLGPEARIVDSLVRFEMDRALPMRSGLTVVVGFPTGLVAAPTASARLGWIVRDNLILLAPVALFGLLFLLWLTRGRDQGDRRSVVVQYEAPEGLSPAEVGTLIDEQAHSTDVTASIIDLAVRGHLRIEADAHDDEDVTLHKLQNADDTLRPFEEALLRQLFADGTTAALDDLEHSFYKKLPEIQKMLYIALRDGGYSAGRLDHVRGGWMFLAILGMFTCAGLAALFIKQAMFAPVSTGVAATLCALQLPFFAWRMPRKTAKGRRAVEHVKGLEEYIRRATLEEMDARARRTQFERLLPYAMALNLSKQWAKRFEGLYMEPPEWYRGPLDGSFTPVVLVSHLSRSTDSLTHAMTVAPRSSSSGSSFGSGGSGFSGGFSGGGGGGGGGGGW